VIVFDSDFILYDLHEVVERTGLSRWKLSVCIRKGALAAVHHGGKWMVGSEELDRFRRAYRSPGRYRPVGVPRRFVPPPRPADVEDVG
jgi:hypothetical protein